ncbi:tRNA (guanine(9)-N(1))-methyltransferase [Exophiala xenobiotica]|nr:tRNA (guanine(9)-N(1))-methyltransferase [Exophiala xenobiotica]KAK5226684.1 tRNA (guanine(9)-N(1))-methyltransferase [Exophiala xenobiotica]KAK5252736.1 tRNA (guanine(9)-N(1))-methyltransferase [Exophiala xenobiotica]KAK5284327.1 tRNA (guanine(9)-N(1))-methyltransferase [Exophiala xenobiotica]KAK5348971.1 tRNA (guanine(9)-N(1))-methyltransferase [Exophiala xenobiotica]
MSRRFIYSANKEDAMEADERPTKLRKLDNGDSANQTAPDAPLPSTPNDIAPESLLTAPSHNNRAVYVEKEEEEGESEDGDDVEDSPESRQQRQENGVLAESMSKSQLKKLRKREEWEAGRDYRKLKRKEKLQEKRAKKKAAKEEEELRVEQLKKEATERGEDPGTVSAELQKPEKQKWRRPVQLPVTIIIDCGFDELMMEKERISLGSQLTRSYSDNWRAPFQAHLVISSWGGLLKERFDTLLKKHYLNWKNVTFEEGDFMEAARNAEVFMNGPKGGRLAGYFEKFAGPNGYVEAMTTTNSTDLKTLASAAAETVNPPAQPQTGDSSASEKNQADENPESAQKDPPPSDSTSEPAHPRKGELVYLTSDSSDTLTELSPYSTYIVGGLVDKNRHKGICYKIAQEKGIKTARLPIGDYMDMQSRKVLTTNHVVEIMIRWLECGDWGEAFMKVIPKRKGGKLRGESKPNADGSDGEENDHEQNDSELSTEQVDAS